MKKAIIIHCWEGAPDYCWYPWLKGELEAINFEVQVPVMPETNLPKQKLWVPKIHELVGEPNKNLILIGHSIGCISILRYLESLKENQMIGGAVLVAGFTDDLGIEEIANYFETPIDFEKIKSHCPKFVAINSDNDPFVPLKHANILKAKLGAEIIIKHNMGHFSGSIEGEESCTDLPDALNAVLKISK
ncbi:alpha/beta hydrolase [Patescibacteria group bacterium]|nr:alpha/beta hydrolase [Patescibacteria group bacterium]